MTAPGDQHWLKQAAEDAGLRQPTAVHPFVQRLEDTGRRPAAVHPFVQRLADGGLLPTAAAAPSLRAVGDLAPWAESALAREFQAVATAPEGSRNDQLNTSAFNLGQIVGGGALSETVVTEQLMRAAVASGLPAGEAMATIASGLRAGIAVPRRPPEREPIAPAATIEVPPEGEPPRLASIVLSRSALRSLPDPEPMIDNVLDQGTVALLYGKWGSYKSFIALDWAASVATGRPWQNRPTVQRNVLYVAAEGAFGYKPRVDAWEHGWHTTIRDGDLDFLPQPINLTNALAVAELAALIEWNGYGLVVIDTLARCMVGADENSAKDCGQVVDVLARLREHTPGGRGVVLGVHHTGKDGKTFRGSSVFEGGADTVYSVVLDGGVATLDREKRKDGPREDTHELSLDLVPGTESAVMSVHGARGHSGSADRLLSIFVQHFAETGASKPELRNVAELPNSTFHRGLSELLKRHALINHGTDQRPFYRLAGK